MVGGPTGMFDDELVDRLVDGELSEEERLAVLSALPRDAELCRRVALAFLEAQVWARSLKKELARGRPYEAGPDVSREFSHRESGDRGPSSEAGDRMARAGAAGNLRGLRSRLLAKIGPVLGMTASFLVGVGVAWWGLTQAWKTGGTSPLSEHPVAAAPEDGKSTSLVGTPYPIQMVTFPVSVESNGNVTALEVPVLTPPEGSPFIVWPDSVLPAQVLESLRRGGHTVKQQRHFVPVSLPDGRQSIVPIDQVEIHFVGQQDFR